jgi:ribosomal-protein-alanine N-acetyltransferase
MTAPLHALTSAHAPILTGLHAEASDAPWNADSFASLLRHQHRFGWLIEDEGAPAGYILVQAIAGEAEILSLAVKPAMQRRGLGRRLIERALEEVERRGAKRLLLEVATSNAPALALYAGLGFSTIGGRRAYYQRRGGLEDALVMAYVFTEPGIKQGPQGAAAWPSRTKPQV